MDATALRWILAIIGVIFIAGIYIYTQYQNKLRRRSAIRTFTREELDVDFIEDDLLREELSHINTMLDEGLNREELNEIKINPGLDDSSENPPTQECVEDVESSIFLPPPAYEVPEEFLVAYVLKPVADCLLSGSDLLSAFETAEFIGSSKNKDKGFFYFDEDKDIHLTLANMSSSGSFQSIEQDSFKAYGVLCFFDMRESQNPRLGYELMLKKIDQLVRLLNLKVYDQNLQLLTLQHVTDIRNRLKSE